MLKPITKSASTDKNRNMEVVLYKRSSKPTVVLPTNKKTSNVVKELNAKTGSCQKTQDKKSLSLRQMEGAIILGKYDLTA